MQLLGPRYILFNNINYHKIIHYRIDINHEMEFNN